jgi:hypothetical protein
MTQRLLTIGLILLAVVYAAPYAAPHDPPWQSTLTSAWGTAPLRDGLNGARFLSTTMAPAKWSPMLPNYKGMALRGDVLIASEVTTTEGVTITAALDDLGSPENMVFTSTQQFEMPVCAAAYVSGTVTSLRCVLGGDCTLSAHLDDVQVLRRVACP